MLRHTTADAPSDPGNGCAQELTFGCCRLRPCVLLLPSVRVCVCALAVSQATLGVFSNDAEFLADEDAPEGVQDADDTLPLLPNDSV